MDCQKGLNKLHGKKKNIFLIIDLTLQLNFTFYCRNLYVVLEIMSLMLLLYIDKKIEKDT